MSLLLDTGVLLRLFDRADPEFASIRAAVRILQARGEQLFTTHQNIAEFWNVSTRPKTARSGYGLPPASIGPRIAFIERLCRLLGSDDASYVEWKTLMTQYALSGVSVHDARIVAVMRIQQIPKILTLNAKDFQRYQGIQVLGPQDIVSSTTP